MVSSPVKITEMFPCIIILAPVSKIPCGIHHLQMTVILFALVFCFTCRKWLTHERIAQKIRPYLLEVSFMPLCLFSIWVVMPVSLTWGTIVYRGRLICALSASKFALLLLIAVQWGTTWLLFWFNSRRMPSQPRTRIITTWPRIPTPTCRERQMTSCSRSYLHRRS